MVRFLARRTASAIVVLWLIASTTFFLVEAAPGTPAALFQNPKVSPGSQQLLERALDLDRQITARYFAWLEAVMRGDWGTSFMSGRPVVSVLRDRLPATALLGSSALAVGLLVGTALGLLAGRRPLLAGPGECLPRTEAGAPRDRDGVPRGTPALAGCADRPQPR